MPKERTSVHTEVVDRSPNLSVRTLVCTTDMTPRKEDLTCRWQRTGTCGHNQFQFPVSVCSASIRTIFRLKMSNFERIRIRWKVLRCSPSRRVQTMGLHLHFHTNTIVFLYETTKSLLHAIFTSHYNEPSDIKMSCLFEKCTDIEWANETKLLNEQARSR